MKQATVLYDRDCGLCRTVMGVVLSLDRRRGLRPLALQSPEAVTLLPGFSEERRMASFHLVEPDGTIHSAGDALAELVFRLPGGGPMGRAARRRPSDTERVYQLVADNRDRIGPLIPIALKERATRVIDRRS